MSASATPTKETVVEQTLPSWYVYTTADLRERLHRDMLRSHHIRTQLNQALSGLQDLSSFARPLLSKALEQAFGAGLDVDRDHFFHARFAESSLLLPGKLTERSFAVQTLLESALQNFHQEEVEAATADSVIFHGKPNLATFAARTCYPHPLKVSPAKFMALCRALDLGGKYQAHLQRILEPTASELRPGASSKEQVKDLFGHQVRNALYVEAHLAYMQGEEVLCGDAYRSVLSATGHQAEKGAAEVVDIQHLTLLGFAVRDVLVFQARGRNGCVVYMPGDPVAPLKEYDSLAQFAQQLCSKLRRTGYQQYFAGFIAQRRKAEFIGKLRECLTPTRLRPVPGDTGFIRRKWQVLEVDENADLKIQAYAIPYTLLDHIYFQRMLRIKDDARSLAVPTGDEDIASRKARLVSYFELGMNIANLAALFVPVLGEIMMVVAGAQLLDETFQGIEAWAQGDMEQALEHLGSVAENLAMLAVFAAAGKAASPAEAPAIKGSSFVGNMIPVKLENGQTRLWVPDLAPFAMDVAMPEGMQPTAEGVFTYRGTHYISLQGQFYRVELDSTLNKWRIKAPRNTRFSPRLENNGAGAWRHEGENPLGWDTKTSFRRLGYSVAGLSEQAAEEVLAVTGTDHGSLTQLHLDNQPPSPGLTDAVERFALNEQVLSFQEQIADASRFESASVELQLQLLPALEGWPKERSITVRGRQVDLNETLHEAPSIVVTQAQVDEGQLLTVVLDALTDSEKSEIFTAPEPASASNLAVKLGQLAQGRLPLLFDRLNQLREASADPLVQLIKRDFPGLSTVAAKELLLEADAEQLAGMQSTQAIPLEIAGKARGYLQQTRLNEALEGFFLASQAGNPDTQTLALHLLRDLPGWPQDLRIEIHDGAFSGPLLDAIGERSAAQQSILVRGGNSYQAFDISGGTLQSSPLDSNDFFAAILRSLPQVGRDAIGFPDPSADAGGLRERIIREATRERGRTAQILGQRAIKPGFRGPERLADGRLGYVLSGRGSPIHGLPAGGDELIAALNVLYPETPGVLLHVRNLMVRGWTIGQLLEVTRARLQSWDMLRNALEGWVNPVGPGSSISSQQFAARESVAQAIGRAWRFSDPISPMHSSNMLLENIDLTGFSGLPDLPAHYAEIHYLTLSRVTAGAEDINRLLGRFPEIQRLEILSGGLTALPEGLAGMRRLNHLSLEGMRLNIDQPAMDLFMQIPMLTELDLTGNLVGNITDVSRLRATTLWLNETGLTDWPEWVDTLPLETLDISDNQIVYLPEYVIENSVGMPSQLTIHAYGNPIDHEDLRRFWLNDRGYGMTYQIEFDFPADIRALEVETTSGDDGSSDDDTDWHVHNPRQAVIAPPVPVLDIWLVEGRTELNARLRNAWQGVEEAGDAPNLLVLLQRLREAPDFRRFHEELANDVMNVLEVAANDPALRSELEVMANDRLFGADQTCQDGARLIFSDIQVAVYARTALQGVAEAQYTEVLLQVVRRLFRLNEVQVIADLDIATREAQGMPVDHAEVRMAYRIGLASDLDLPGQPLSMAWDRLASVDRQAILDARRLVLERETGAELTDYAVADRRWNQRLRVEYEADLRRVTAPVRAQMLALEEHPPVDLVRELQLRGEIYERLNTAHASRDSRALNQASLDLVELTANPPINHDEYDRQGRALIASLAAAENALLAQLTNTLRQRWFSPAAA